MRWICHQNDSTDDLDNMRRSSLTIVNIPLKKLKGVDNQQQTISKMHREVHILCKYLLNISDYSKLYHYIQFFRIRI